MKQTLFLTLFSLSTFMTVCSGQTAIVDYIPLSSNSCDAINKKIMRLDRFTEVVNNTSAFHLEEKASALPSPGISVSNNKKKMLRDAKKKRAEYLAEHQKQGCETSVASTTVQRADKTAVADNTSLSSEQCTTIEKRIMRLDRFTEVVKKTSAFHLEEKASALPSPGISVSNNKKKMLRDAKKKRAEYLAEHQKQGCETSIASTTVQRADKTAVTDNTPLSSTPRTMIEKEPIKSTTKVTNTSVVSLEKKAVVVPVAKTTVSSHKEQILRDEKKKHTEFSVKRQAYDHKTSVIPETIKMADKMTVVDDSAFSSEECNNLDQELIELYEFTSMVKNTSAFHLAEKASALPSPGFTVSNNKKKMLRDIEQRHSELLKERKKYGCEPL